MPTEAGLVQTQVDQLLHSHPPDTTEPSQFWGAQFDLGLAWVHFPVGQGGLGVSAGLQELVNRTLDLAGAPSNFSTNGIGVGMAGPVIQQYGSDDHRSRFLRKIWTCAEIWCQLFSEPGAGSDVAALSTRAVRDGDEWIVDGQKVWTTLAHLASWGLLLTRTDTEATKHKGMTYFIVDMRAPGVEVRPMRQMTGSAEFNEVFFTNVSVNDADRLGDIGDGWRIAITTLMNERNAISAMGATPQGAGVIGDAVSLWQSRPRRMPGDRALRDRVTRLWIESEVMRLSSIRSRQCAEAGTPGPEQSIGKLAATENMKRVNDLCVDLLGADGMLIDDYEMTRPDHIGEAGHDIVKSFLRSRASTIEGGTSEVMRNILGERVLGLPGDVRVDKDLPWSKVPRS